jgi:hypothetical protein
VPSLRPKSLTRFLSQQSEVLTDFDEDTSLPLKAKRAPFLLNL